MHLKVRLTADPVVVSLNFKICHISFIENDHKTISMVILSPSAESRRALVSYWQKYVHKVLVTSLED